LKAIAVKVSAIVAFLVVASNPQTTIAADDPVTYIRPGVTGSTFVPDNLNWSAKSLAAASKAIIYLKQEVLGEMKTLQIVGSKTITREYIPTDDIEPYSDWNKYVKVIDSYVLIGKNSKGETLATSRQLPLVQRNIETRLIQLKSRSCALNKPVKDVPSIAPCGFLEVDKSKFLRASLATFLNRGTNRDEAQAWYYRDQLSTCLANKYPFSISNGIFSCPKLSNVYADGHKFPISKRYKRFSYTMKIDAKKYTATMTVSDVPLEKMVPEAYVYDGGFLAWDY
jgi:hypothetical protein